MLRIIGYLVLKKKFLRSLKDFYFYFYFYFCFDEGSQKDFLKIRNNKIKA